MHRDATVGTGAQTRKQRAPAGFEGDHFVAGSEAQDGGSMAEPPRASVMEWIWATFHAQQSQQSKHPHTAHRRIWPPRPLGPTDSMETSDPCPLADGDYEQTKIKLLPSPHWSETPDSCKSCSLDPRHVGSRTDPCIPTPWLRPPA